jgi:hypothetical protein
MATADNSAIAGSPGRLPAIVVAIEKAKRREAVSFRVRFLLTWAVIVIAVVGLVIIGSHSNPRFHLEEWLPFIIGGVGMT